MAVKTFYATKGLKYNTRRLQAGDPIELDASQARLYTALGAVTDQKPRNAVKAEAPAEPVKKPATKRAPRKRAAKKAK